MGVNAVFFAFVLNRTKLELSFEIHMCLIQETLVYIVIFSGNINQTYNDIQI